MAATGASATRSLRASVLPRQARADLPGPDGRIVAGCESIEFTGGHMGKTHWKIAAAIGALLFSQTASAEPSGRAEMVAGNLAYQNVSQPLDAKNNAIAVFSRDVGAGLNDSDARSDPDKVDLDNSSVGRLAQTGEPAASTPALKRPQDQPPPANPSPPNPTAKATVVRSGPTAVGCGLKFLTAEISGKLKGRKWKEFREQECGPISTNAVFPSAIAPKYSGENPDKARTLTCVDQFNANKATNANDGLRWIDKGGGYYSECIARLKG